MLGEADYTAPTGRHELHPTDQEIYLPCLVDIGHEVGVGDRSDVWFKATNLANQQTG